MGGFAGQENLRAGTRASDSKLVTSPSHYAAGSYTGLLPEPPVFFAKCGFENCRFPARTHDLHWDDEDEREQQPPGGNEHRETQEKEAAEDVDGIADARVQAGRDQTRGPGANGKRAAQLDAG